MGTLDVTIQYNTIQLFYCFISFHMRHSQNTFINMFNRNAKNDISFSIMLNKRSIWKKRKYLFSYAELFYMLNAEIFYFIICYWSIALQMEHCFLAITFKSKIGILNLIRKIYFNQKTLTKNTFLKFVYVFINAGIGWNFNILNVLCQITFPSCTFSDMDQWPSVEYKTMYILI